MTMLSRHLNCGQIHENRDLMMTYETGVLNHSKNDFSPQKNHIDREIFLWGSLITDMSRKVSLHM